MLGGLTLIEWRKNVYLSFTILRDHPHVSLTNAG